MATNTAAEVLGNPLNSLAWLANNLAERGLGLRAGDLVMSGSICDAPAAEGGRRGDRALHPPWFCERAVRMRRT